MTLTCSWLLSGQSLQALGPRLLGGGLLAPLRGCFWGTCFLLPDWVPSSLPGHAPSGPGAPPPPRVPQQGDLGPCWGLSRH